MSGVGIGSSRRTLALMGGFVAAATVAPAVVIPLGFVVVASSAVGISPGRIARSRGWTRQPHWKIMRRAMLALLATLLVTMAVVVPAMASSPRIAPDAGAGIARLRVYPYGFSGDPAVDPIYVGADPDPWIEDSWILNVTGDLATFGLNVTNRHSFQAYDIRLRIAVNDVSLLNSVSLTITQGDAPNPQVLPPASFPFGTPTLANGAAWPSHGIYATWYANYSLGGLGPLGSANDTVVISVTVDGGFTDGLLVHFDADGWTVLENQGRSPIMSDDPNDTNIRNPNSADTTVRIPSVSSVALSAALAGLVVMLGIRRKKKSP